MKRFWLAVLSIFAAGTLAGAPGALRFEQLGSDQYIAQGPGYVLRVEPSGIVLRAGGDVKIGFPGGNRGAKLEALDKQSSVTNYFLSSNRSEWRTNVPNFARVAVRGVYPGIDLVFYGKDGELEYDWVVAPNADASRIRMKFTGAERIRQRADGDLSVEVAGASVLQRAPVVMQEGKRIGGRFVVRGSEIAFALDGYDRRKQVVIDPTLIYSTYIGSNTADGGTVAHAVAVDAAGNAYVTGVTTAPLLAISGPGPTSLGPFVMKFSPAGALVYATYLGLNGAGYAIAIDATGAAYVAGQAGANFPLAGAIQSSQGAGFITKLSPAGSALVYSTYYGVSSIPTGIAVDSNLNAIVAGPTGSSPLPLVNAAQSTFGGGGTDVFVAKVNTQGSALVYSTYLGGSQADNANGVAVDASGNAYITGSSQGSGFPVLHPLVASNGATNGAFVTKYSPTGTILNSTFLCNGSNGTGIAVDTTGNIYVTGSTGGGTFPTANALQNTPGGSQDAFVLKMNAAETALIYSTYLGASGSDVGLAIAVDAGGSAYVAGQAGVGFPLVSPIQTSGGSFVTKLNPAGSALTFSTYLPTPYTYGIGADAQGHAYVVGFTSAKLFPLLHPVQGYLSAAQDAFVTAITLDAATVPILGIVKTHSSPFTAGNSGDYYTITVVNMNASGLPTAGTVTVTDTPPTGVTISQMSGTGWNCTGNTCTRSDALAPGASYPNITVAVKVAGSVTLPVVNSATVSGGGAASVTTFDSTALDLVEMTVSGGDLVFGVQGSTITNPQILTVNFTNNLPGHWSAVSSVANVTLSPSSGIGPTNVTVTAAPGANGTITFTDQTYGTPPIVIHVTLVGVNGEQLFGSFDTPVNNTTGVTGSIAVTGWALSSIQVTKVDIWRDPVGTEPVSSNGLVYIGDAVFVAGARPDVAAQYPALPLSNRAGWGYLLLTSGLPNSGGSPGPGNGVYKLHAFAHGTTNVILDLGTKTITVDNAHATKPFGTLDTPGQGATASGTQFVNFGWALTQNPHCIPTNGSTITVTVDGVTLGNPVYNQTRADVAAAFPGRCNTNGAGGYYIFDTTHYQNGQHTIGWTVYDDGGFGDGIGSRFFTIFNTSGPVAGLPDEPPPAIPNEVTVRRGHGRGTDVMRAGQVVEIEELDSIEINAGGWHGYQVINGQRQALPVGSTLKGGVFYWQTAPGFLGNFDLVFERAGAEEVRVRVNVRAKEYARAEQ